jgi:hypothetical protein
MASMSSRWDERKEESLKIMMDSIGTCTLWDLLTISKLRNQTIFSFLANSMMIVKSACSSNSRITKIKLNSKIYSKLRSKRLL